jgi:hypothetical protein
VKKVAIERISTPDPRAFAREYLVGEGRPVILADAISHWKALSTWTFERFKAAYGHDLVPVSLGGSVAAAWKMTKLSAFIDHLDAPGEDLPGFWVDRQGKPLNAVPERGALRYYLMGWNALCRHPELSAEIKPSPAFVSDWTTALDPLRLQMVEWINDKELTSVYVGPADTLSPLHRDFGHTHAYLAQIRGTKEAILFSPDDTQRVYSGEVDPSAPNPARFPLFDEATAYIGMIEPGDLLFMPPDWWHSVRALEKSITLSHNFFNESNFSRHLSHLFRKAHRLAEGIAQHPEWREVLGKEPDISAAGES